MWLISSYCQPVLGKSDKELELVINIWKYIGQILKTIIQSLNKKQLQFRIIIQTLKLCNSFRTFCIFIYFGCRSRQVLYNLFLHHIKQQYKNDYNFIIVSCLSMALNKNQIMQLQHVLSPATRKFNILQVIEKFPDNPHMHQTFRQICLHYQQSSLSFKQIIQYLFGQFNRVSQLTQTVQDKTQLFRIAKNYTELEFKVALLGAKSEGIKQLIMVDEKVLDNNKVIEGQLYAATNTTIYQFNMKKQSFTDKVLKINSSVFSKVAVYGNILIFLNKINQMYMQILPQKLAQSVKKHNKSKQKTQITKALIAQFPANEPVISLLPLNQQQWVMCTANKIRLIKLPLSPQTQQFKPQISEMIVSQEQNFAILSVCLLEQNYVGLLTNKQSIMIVHLQKMKITNSIYNDTNFAAFSYNQAHQALIVSDFGGYLMSMKFNRDFGDIEEQGISYKKKKRQQILPFHSNNDQFQTHYIKNKNKSPQKHLLVGDPPLSKQRKTAFSIVVQNTNRSVLQMVLTKQRSIFTYQGKYKSIVKLWNVKNLLVYQKIDLSVRINDMKICRNGLYLISSEKEYLCFYPMEANDNANSKKMPLQVLQLGVSSNMLYINTTNMSESIVYKINLSNKPSISEYCRKASKNPQKVFKYAFYKNQVILFNLMRSYSPSLQISGIFGQPKQKINDLRDYHSMIRYEEKQGVIIWGNRRVKIRGKYKKNDLIYQRKQKGQQVVTNYADNGLDDSPYFQTIILRQQISKIKHFQNYITIITNSCIDKKTNVYIIDQNTMCVVVVFNQISDEYRLLQSHKNCCLIMKKIYNKGQVKRQYFLYDNDNNRIIWISQQIQGWIFQSVYLLSVNNSDVQIICTYKSNSIGSDKQNKPIFYLIKNKIRLRNSQKKFISIERQFSRMSQNQTHTLEELFNRSIFRKITMKQLQTSPSYEQTVSKNNYKIYFPSAEIKKNESYIIAIKNRNKNLQSEIKSIEGRLLYSDKSQNNFMFGVTLNGMAIFYQMSEEVQAQIIGILDFQLLNHDHPLTDCIVYWNKKYKYDDEQLWQSAKNRAINRAKNNSPLTLLRSDSLRQTNRMWNPQQIQQNLVLDKQKKSLKRRKSHTKQKSQLETDPSRINQLLFKHNIQKGIMGQNKKNQELDEKLNKSKIKQGQLNKKQIQTLIDNIKQSKELFLQPKTNRSMKKDQKSMSLKTLKTQYSEISSKYDLTRKNTGTSKKRYETQAEAMLQLEKSKILQQLMLPKITNTRTQSIQMQKQKKNSIYELLKKQNTSLKLSRNFQSRPIEG